MKRQPIVFQWRVADVILKDGEVVRSNVMVPLRRYANACRRQFGEADGGEHALEQVVDRDMKSHNAFFAEMNDLFGSVPENIAFMLDAQGKRVLDDFDQPILRWPTSEHFRKWLLIETGWNEEKEFECLNREHAKRLGLYMRTEDDYCRISLRGNRVVVKKAKSQSVAEMGATDFEASKKDVLDLARAMVGVTATESRRSAGRSA